MTKKYFFIGDSHADHLVPGNPKRFHEYSLYKEDNNNKAISFHKKPTIFSFPLVVDKNIERYIDEIKETDAVVFVFGLNDAIEIRKNEIKFEVFIPQYVSKINKIAIDLQLDTVLIISPTNCSDLKNNENWKERINTFYLHKDLTKRLEQIDLLLSEECKKYKNINYISMLGVFADSDDILKEEYSLDGIHLNNFGYSIFISKLDYFLNNKYLS